MITQTQASPPNSFHSWTFHCNASFPAYQTFSFHISTPHMLSLSSAHSAHCSYFRTFQCNIGHSTQLLTSPPTDVTKLRLDARYHSLCVCVFGRVCVFHFVLSTPTARAASQILWSSSTLCLVMLFKRSQAWSEQPDFLKSTAARWTLERTLSLTKDVWQYSR